MISHSSRLGQLIMDMHALLLTIRMYSAIPEHTAARRARLTLRLFVPENRFTMVLRSFNPSTSLRLTRQIPLGPEEDLPFAFFGSLRRCAGAAGDTLAYHSDSFIVSPETGGVGSRPCLLACQGGRRLERHDAFSTVGLDNNEATYCTCRSHFRRG